MGQEAPPVDPAEQYSTNDRRTGSGSWSLRSRYTGEPLALRVRTPRSVQEGWPFDGRHYATSVEVAMARFAEAGFTCGTSCSRASDGQTINFDDHDGQIVVARFTLRSSIDGDRSADPASRWVRDGLPFLTPAVRAAVSRRVEECRINRCSWSGVVAGTPVDAVTVPGASTTRDGRPAADLMVTIGIRLLRSA